MAAAVSDLYNPNRGLFLAYSLSSEKGRTEVAFTIYNDRDNILQICDARAHITPRAKHPDLDLETVPGDWGVEVFDHPGMVSPLLKFCCPVSGPGIQCMLKLAGTGRCLSSL